MSEKTRMGRIRGSYPGGPKRGGAADPGGSTPTPRLERVEDVEARLGQLSRARERRRRARRVWSGFVMAVVLAAGTGLYLGMRAHRSSEQLTDERNQVREREMDLTRETNRVLLELWRMEAVEKQVSPP